MNPTAALTVYAWSPWLYWCSPEIHKHCCIVLAYSYIMHCTYDYWMTLWAWSIKYCCTFLTYTLALYTHDHPSLTLFLHIYTFLFCWILYILKMLSPSVCFDTYNKWARDPLTFESCTIILLVFQLASTSNCYLLCWSVWIYLAVIQHKLSTISYIMLVYVHKIPCLATAVCGFVLLHPKHHHFGCFSHFSLLVLSSMVKLLVILRCVTLSALVLNHHQEITLWHIAMACIPVDV